MSEIDHRRDPHPQSAPGDFYVEDEACISCGAPHAVAPDLIGWSVDDETGTNGAHCIWKKQPQTPEEFEQAFAAFDASCIGAYRYAGDNPAVRDRIGSLYCDHPDLAGTALSERDQKSENERLEREYQQLKRTIVAWFRGLFGRWLHSLRAKRLIWRASRMPPRWIEHRQRLRQCDSAFQTERYSPNASSSCCSLLAPRTLSQ